MIRFAKTRQFAIAGLALLGAAAPRSTSSPVRFDWFEYQGRDVTGRVGKGSYSNPILPGFYPDPSIIRVGTDFYLVNSTFAYFPGLPVFHSRDLIHWTQIANAIDRPGQIDLTGRKLSDGLYAPAIHHANGRFYIVNTCVRCGGNFIITADRPSGPWSDPVWLRDVPGFNPSLFTDADGSSWLIYNDEPDGKPLYKGHHVIRIRRFDLTHLRAAGPATVAINGGIDLAKRPIWVEGPHLFRHANRYYLIAAEGGTAEQHSETVYRADRPDGPFVPYPRAILTQRDLPDDRPNPITSAGHAEFVDTPKGDWWAAFLATRPYAGRHYNTGRETFLMHVDWQDGWPIVTRPGQLVPYAASRPALPSTPTTGFALSGNFTLRDDFRRKALAPYWLMVRTPGAHWWQTGLAGLTLQPRPAPIGGLGQPSYIGRRQQHLYAVATTQLVLPVTVPGEKAGLVAYQNEAHYYFAGVVDLGNRRVLRVERRAGDGDPVAGTVVAERPLPADARSTLRLRIVADGGRYSFDYALASDGKWRRLLKDADGTILSTASADGFVGVTLGMYTYAP